MNGLSILRHAVGMVANNAGIALRISAGLMALQLVVALLLGVGFVYTGADMSDLIVSGQFPFAPVALVVALQAVSALWIAVAWHRFILLEEVPGSALPRFNGAAILAYLVAGIIFVLVLLIVAIPFSILAGLLAVPLMVSGTDTGITFSALILFVLLWLPVAYISYRISPILPSAAIQKRLPLKEAWYVTGTSGAAFVVLALASVLLAWLVNLPVGLLGTVSPFLAFLWAFAVQWAVLLVGASILTTIYGHYVEKRPLNE